ncbi:MAG: helix-turn-helix domain-containing protein [Dehalococcoidia bacterium]
MASFIVGQELVAVSEGERWTLVEADRLLEDDEAAVLLVAGPSRETIPLSAPALRVYKQVVHLLARGEDVILVPLHRELTTQEAANLLNVSRPFLVQLLERGEIPFTRTGSHRRIRFGDVMDYKERRDANRRTALAELTRFSDELGLYDDEPAFPE